MNNFDSEEMDIMAAMLAVVQTEPRGLRMEELIDRAAAILGYNEITGAQFCADKGFDPDSIIQAGPNARAAIKIVT